MNKKVALGILLLLTLFILIHIKTPSIPSMHLKGKEDPWIASLSIDTTGGCVLIIRPRRDNFLIPQTLEISLWNEKILLHTETLLYTSNKNNKDFLGNFSSQFNLSKYRIEKFDQLKIKIKYFNNTNIVEIKNTL